MSQYQGGALDVIGNIAAKMVGNDQREVIFSNNTNVDVMVVIAQEDFELEVEAKAGIAAGVLGIGAQVVKKGTKKPLPKLQTVLRAHKPQRILVSLNCTSFFKIYSKPQANVPWDQATLTKHYEAQLGEHVKRVNFKDEYLDVQLGQITRPMPSPPPPQQHAQQAQPKQVKLPPQVQKVPIPQAWAPKVPAPPAHQPPPPPPPPPPPQQQQSPAALIADKLWGEVYAAAKQYNFDQVMALLDKVQSPGKHKAPSKVLAALLAKSNPHSGWTLLHQAASSGSASAVAQLLTRGSPPVLKNAKGKTPLEIAVEGGHQSAAQLLREAIGGGVHKGGKDAAHAGKADGIMKPAAGGKHHMQGGAAGGKQQGGAAGGKQLGGGAGGGADGGGKKPPGTPLKRYNTEHLFAPGSETSPHLAHQTLQSVIDMKVGAYALVRRGATVAPDGASAFTLAEFLGWRMVHNHPQPQMCFRVSKKDAHAASLSKGERFYPLSSRLADDIKPAKVTHLFSA